METIDIIILSYLFVAFFIAFPILYFIVSREKEDEHNSMAVIIPAKIIASFIFCLIWIIWLPFFLLEMKKC